MADGGLEPGERFARLEAGLERVLKEVSIERHRVTNLLQVQKFHTEIIASIKDHEARIGVLERNETVDEAVAAAFDAAKKQAETNRRWMVGAALSLGVLMVGVLGLLVQVLGRV